MMHKRLIFPTQGGSMLQILLILNLLLAESPSPQKGPEALWQDWKKETFEKPLNSPTSFLNAFSLEQSLSGKSLYLVLDKKKRGTRWVKTEPKKFYAQAEHLGASIRIQVYGKTIGYVKNEPDKRRKTLKLPNGAVAEVVFGKRNQKMWGYLYDPDQIKKFSGFQFFPYNEGAVVKGIFKAQKPRFVSYKTVQGDPTKVRQLGNVSFIIHGKEFYLPAYNWQKPGKRITYVALVFTDNTKGVETYGGGRELVIDLPNGIEETLELSIDFNQTLNFYCAHSPFWHCPVGLQKHIDVKVNAGEKLPKTKIM